LPEAGKLLRKSRGFHAAVDKKQLTHITPAMTGAIRLKGKSLGTMIVESRPLCYNLEDVKKEIKYLQDWAVELEAREKKDANV